MFSSQLSFFYLLGWAVISSFWQMAILWLFYKFLISALAVKNPSQKSALASCLLLTGFTGFVLTLLITDFSGNITALFPTAGTEYSIVWPVFFQLLPYASGLYLLLLLFSILRFIKNYRYATIIRRYKTSKPKVEWRLFVQKRAPLMGIRKKVTVIVSEFIHSPLTIGFIKPVILLPLSAISNLSPHQLEALLLHELSHIRRNDYLLNFIIQFVKTLLYFNPFVNAFVKEIEKEREKSCDRMVLQYQYNANDYASALLKLQQAEQPVFYLAASGTSDGLSERINLIIGQPGKKKNKFNLFTLFAFLFAFLFFSIGYNNSKKSIQPKLSPGIFSSSYFASLVSQPSYAATISSDNKSNSSEVKRTKAFIAKTVTQKQTEPENNTIIPDNGIRFVNYQPVTTPELKKYQEDQVKTVIESSKRIAGELQWKQVEKSLAEVFTTEEKKQLHDLLSKKMEQYNWSQFENKLKMVYERVDWEKLNYKLNTEVAKVQRDSILTTFTVEIAKLNKAVSVLKENSITSVPDTDITLQVIEERKKQISTLLDSLRSRRIIKL